MHSILDKKLIKPISRRDRELIEKYFKEQINSKEILSQEEKKYVNYFLINYKEWRDILIKLGEDDLEKKSTLKPANNINYIGKFKIAIVASLATVLFAIPPIKNFPDELGSLKGSVEERGFVEKCLYYWEQRIAELLGK